MSEIAIRKIIHIDMDAFYASVELKRQPHLADQPVVISSHHPRAVIAAASYKAREFGLRSAMPMSQARKRCPHVVVIEPDFAEYRRVSAQIHQIFQRYTPLIEPLSLDEAYLDVTQNLQGLASATEVAIQIRAQIEATTGLTASAGVAPNKFLAKVASDWNKPNGICVIKPHQVNAFIEHLSLDKIPGVGRVTLAKLQQMNLNCLGDVQRIPVEVLVKQLGKYGHLLHQFAHGIDHRPVQHERERQQISKEITFDYDRGLSECVSAWSDLLDQVWHSLESKQLQAKTVHIKLRHPDFQTIAHQRTYRQAFQDRASLALAMQQLLSELPTQAHEKFRLIGVGVSQLEARQHAAQMELW